MLSTCVRRYIHVHNMVRLWCGYSTDTPYHFEFYKVVILQLPARKELNNRIL